jgi:hypothetical protein
MSLILHTVFGNFRSNSILAAAEFGEVDIQTNAMQWEDLKSKDNL